jgi:uncharacterized protein (TIGR00299 family) protein
MAGISGDMLLAALIDAGAEIEAIQRVLDLIPQNFSRCKAIKLNAQQVRKHGFRSCRVELTITEGSQETRAQELIETTEKIANLANFGERAKSFANDAVRLLTEVESTLHGVEISSTHLHEAGSADTLADILGTAAACQSLNIFEGEVYSCPLAVGGGTVSFSHGTVSVPAPAVLEITRRFHIPVIGGPSSEELATPTGVSMLASLVDTFVERLPPLVPDRVGYGAGKKEMADVPNVLRVVIGQSAAQRFDEDYVHVIETNLDDVSGEVIGGSIEAILDAGARDVWITPAQFKKSRPGCTLHAICAQNDLEKISEVMMKETGTLGVRFQRWDRFILQREIVLVKLQVDEQIFDVRVKLARDRSGKILRMKPEFEDVESISRATSRSAREILALASEEARKIYGMGGGS